jgi:hypothetical protein
LQTSYNASAIKSICINCKVCAKYIVTQEGLVRKHLNLKLLSLYIATGLPFILTQPAFAVGDVSSVETFIRSLIQVLAGLAGLVATGFIVVGGFGYITSSGNPERMDRAKSTIMWSGIGLAITVAAFVISNIVTTLATNAFGK